MRGVFEISSRMDLFLICPVEQLREVIPAEAVFTSNCHYKAYTGMEVTSYLSSSLEYDVISNELHVLITFPSREGGE
jgi:hypothetical protein